MKKTKIFLLVILVVIIVFDVWIINQEGKKSSISWFVISELKRDYPLINDAWWFSMGHLFWRMKDPTKKEDV